MLRLFIDERWVFRILRHAILFLSMVLLFAWVAHSRSAGATGFLYDFLMVLVHAFLFFGYAYITIYLLIPLFLAKQKWVVFVGAFFLTGMALSALKFLFSDFLFINALSPENAQSDHAFSLPSLLVNTKDMTFIVALFAIVKYARDHYVLESNIRELKQKGMEAEIKLLEHQTDPHVIFNNFNNLYSISIYRPKILPATIKKLKSILNYLFLESRQQKVLLVREVEMIENYIGLEELRYGERLKVSFRSEGDMEGLKIAPLILYPFVENCFEHGAEEDPHQSWIHIELSVRGSNLRFRAANSVSGMMLRGHDNGSKSANENSIRRLELQYPNSHRLTIRDRMTEHEVELNINLGV
jgi:sensor histidine kinase YesM